MKKLIIPAILIASFIVIFAVNSTSYTDLLDPNVEALTAKESTLTTWRCVDDEEKCHAECGNCHTIIENDGELKGFHICIGY